MERQNQYHIQGPIYGKDARKRIASATQWTNPMTGRHITRRYSYYTRAWTHNANTYLNGS